MQRLILLTYIGLFLGRATSLQDGLARTPVMGWNTWNAFGITIDENLIHSTADLLVELGLAEAGYRTLILDDGWSEPNRTTEGRLVGSYSRFPSGMKSLGEYIHSKGLQFGIYSDAGPLTCAGWPGSRHSEELDAQTWAEWGVDYLKYDNCYAPAEDWVIDRYKAMRDALLQVPRNIVYSLCDWGVRDPWLWGDSVGHSWRTTEDIQPTWQSIIQNVDNSVGLSRYAGPGGWNDLDMLEIGVESPSGGSHSLRVPEQRAHFALWALFKSPLLIGADLRSLNPDSLKILLSKEIIAIHQDPLGVAGDLVWKQGAKEVYAAPMTGGGRAVVFFNRHIATGQYPVSSIAVHWKEVGYPDTLRVMVRDLWQERDIGVFQTSFTAQVAVHDAACYRFTPVEDHGIVFEYWKPWENANVSMFSIHQEDDRDLRPTATDTQSNATSSVLSLY